MTDKVGMFAYFNFPSFKILFFFPKNYYKVSLNEWNKDVGKIFFNVQTDKHDLKKIIEVQLVY